MYFQTEHYDEERRSIDGFKQIADHMAGEIEPYLINIYFKVVEGCLKKHSKRCTSDEVSICVLVGHFPIE